MSRFPSDYLPIDKNETLIYTGEIAPNTRILMEVPPEFQGNPEAPAYLNKVREAVVTRYSGKAGRTLRSFRQDMALGSIGATERRSKIDEHVSVDYVNQFGREQYTLNVSEGLVREVLEELNPLCLLVLHNDSQVTAIPMDSVYAGFFKPIYSAETQRSWGYDPIVNAQEQMSKSTSVATAFGMWFIHGLGVYEAASGDGGAGDKTSIMNGTGSATSASVHTQYYDYTIDLINKTIHDTYNGAVSEPTAVSSDGERKKEDEEDQRDAQGFGIKTTTYHIMDTSLGGGSRAADPPEIIEKKKVYEKKKANEYTRQLLTGWTIGPSQGCVGNGPATPNYIPEENYTEDITEKWDGTLTFHRYGVFNGEFPPEKQWVQKRVETHGPVSFDMLVMFSDPTTYIFGYLVSSGGVGTHYSIVTSETKPEGSTTYYPVGFSWGIVNIGNNSNVMSSTFDGIYLYGGGDWWVQTYNEAFCGAHHISTEISFDGPYSSTPYRRYRTETNPKKSVTPFYFPYAVGGEPYRKEEEQSDSGAVSVTYKTPYGTLGVSDSPYGFNGWLNLHNGRLLVQGCYVFIDGQKTYGLYFDGAKKTEVGGIPVQSIATMFLDVPLDWIKKWSTG